MEKCKTFGRTLRRASDWDKQHRHELSTPSKQLPHREEAPRNGIPADWAPPLYIQKWNRIVTYSRPKQVNTFQGTVSRRRPKPPKYLTCGDLAASESASFPVLLEYLKYKDAGPEQGREHGIEGSRRPRQQIICESSTEFLPPPLSVVYSLGAGLFVGPKHVSELLLKLFRIKLLPGLTLEKASHRDNAMLRKIGRRNTQTNQGNGAPPVDWAHSMKRCFDTKNPLILGSSARSKDEHVEGGRFGPARLTGDRTENPKFAVHSYFARTRQANPT